MPTQRAGNSVQVLTVAALATFLVASPAGAQNFAAWSATLKETAADVQGQLRSGDPRQVAWGAFRAAEHRIEGAVPELLTILEAPPAVEALERSAMIGAVLDAAVQLSAQFPPTLLSTYYDRWPIQTLILLGNVRESGSVLLELLKTASGFRWYAIANLLLERRSPGFAAELLTKIQFRLRLDVVDDGDRLGLGAGRSVSGGVGDGIDVNPEGFPPNAFYRFEMLPRRGFTVLSTGPRPIYYTRTVYYQPQYPTSYPTISGPTDSERMDYVIQLVTLPGRNGIAVQPEQGESVQWRGAEDFVRRASSLRDRLVRDYRRLVSALVKDGQVTDSEAEALAIPRIEVQVVDRRNDRSQPLPTITPIR